MLLPKEPIDWPNFWAGLLQGAGAGLLHYDGSRLAQAALKGLEAFDAAQERRRSRKSGEGATGHERQAEEQQAHAQQAHEQQVRALPWRNMSPAELAAFQQLSQEDQDAFSLEAAEAGLPADGIDHRALPLPVRRQPLSPSPFGGWQFEAILPIDGSGRLNIRPRR